MAATFGAGAVKRVIFTSSTAAVMGAKSYPHVHSEADWSDGGDRDGPKFELPVAYAKSKCDSERLAYCKLRYKCQPFLEFSITNGEIT